MKIQRISHALPLGEIPIETGGQRLDYILTEKDAQMLQEKFNIVEAIGEGMWGMAFQTVDDKVLKITRDDAEIEAAKMLKNEKYGPFAKIYELGTLWGNNSNDIQPYHYILKEKVTPLTNNLQFVFEQYNDSEHEQLKTDFPEEFEKVEDYFYDISNYMMQDVYRSDNVGLGQDGNIVAFDPRVEHMNFN